MCWFAFGDRDFVADTFVEQHLRWTDWFWIINSDLNASIYFATNLWDYKTRTVWFNWESSTNEFYFTTPLNTRKYYSTYERFYTAILEDYLLTDDTNGNFLMHHRKWSVWHNTIENNHPYYWKKFFLMQNWTDKKFHWWGIVEWLNINASDTFMLLHFIERHVSSLSKVPALLDSMSSRWFSFGVIIIGDKNWNMLMYSDWDRSMWIEFEDENKKRIKWFRSTVKTKEFDFKGYMMFDINGNVKKLEYTKLNEAKPEKARQTWGSHGAWTGSSQGSMFTPGEFSKQTTKTYPPYTAPSNWKSQETDNYTKVTESWAMIYSQPSIVKHMFTPTIYINTADGNWRDWEFIWNPVTWWMPTVETIDNMFLSKLGRPISETTKKSWIWNIFHRFYDWDAVMIYLKNKVEDISNHIDLALQLWESVEWHTKSYNNYYEQLMERHVALFTVIRNTCLARDMAIDDLFIENLKQRTTVMQNYSLYCNL